jgi:hypothetical protein
MHLRRAAVIAPLIVLLLAGCVPNEPSASPTPGPPPPVPSITPNPTPTIAPTPSPQTEPVTLSCSDLLGAQGIYDYNPNVSLLPSFSPSNDSLAGQALAQQGIACELINQTSGSTIDFGVVRYTNDAYAAKLASVASSATTAGAFDGYFDVTGEGGVAQVFSAPYFLSVAAADFGTAEDVAPLVALALDGLG